MGHRDMVKNAADVLMSMLAEAGGEKPDFFEPMFSNGLGMNNFRPIRYPKRVLNIPKGAYLDDGRSEFCRRTSWTSDVIT